MIKEIKASPTRESGNSSREQDQHSTQQVFLGNDALFLYYTERRTVTNSKTDRRSVIYVPLFFRIPYDAKVELSDRKLTFTGNLRKTNLPATYIPGLITAQDAAIYGKEATLTFFNPATPCKSAFIYRFFDPLEDKEILSAFEHPMPKDADSVDIKSWRILLNQFLIQKRDNVDMDGTAIQTLWFADFLARRRQARLGVKAAEIYTGSENVTESSVWDSGDGRCKRTTVFTKLDKTVLYSLEDQKLKIKRRRPVIFSILSTDENEKTRVCPNCGSESTSEECMNGCPFCGTKFRLTNYTYKLAGNYEGVSHIKPERLLFIPMILIFLVTFIYQFMTSVDVPIMMILISSLSTSVFLGIVFYLAISIPLGIFLFARIVRDNRLSDYCKKVRKNDPNFSTDEFSAEFLSRIRAFFLSDESDNIRFISGLKGGQFLDVADVHLSSIKSIDTVPSPDFFIIRAHVILTLIRVNNGRLIRQKSAFAIDIYRTIQAKTERITDKEVFTCPSCASSISILEGGHCRFCGTTSDLSKHGWVLGAVVPEK